MVLELCQCIPVNPVGLWAAARAISRLYDLSLKFVFVMLRKLLIFFIQVTLIASTYFLEVLTLIDR